MVGVIQSSREIANTSCMPRLSHLRRLSRYALPLLPSGLCYFVQQSGDLFLLTKYSGLEEVGVYAFGNQVARIATFVALSPMLKVWQSSCYSMFESHRRAELFGEAITRVAFMYCAAALMILACVDPIVAVLGSSGYAKSTIVVGPLLIAHFFMGMSQFLEAPFYILEKTAQQLRVTLVSTVVLIALYFAFIPTWGKEDAAFAMVVGMSFTHWRLILPRKETW